jgi:hypothetical protein
VYDQGSVLCDLNGHVCLFFATLIACVMVGKLCLGDREGDFIASRDIYWGHVCVSPLCRGMYLCLRTVFHVKANLFVCLISYIPRSEDLGASIHNRGIRGGGEWTASSPGGKTSLISIGGETGCDTQTVCKLWRRENFPPPGIESQLLGCSIRRPTLCWLSNLDSYNVQLIKHHAMK